MKFLRKIFKGISLTAVLFVFQACYGTPQVPTGMENLEDSVVGETVTSDEVAPAGEQCALPEEEAAEEAPVASE